MGLSVEGKIKQILPVEGGTRMEKAGFRNRYWCSV